MAVFVICTNKKCEGPGVAEYTDDYVIDRHMCGFCSHETFDEQGNSLGVNAVPVRAATEKEIKAYQDRDGRPKQEA